MTSNLFHNCTITLCTVKPKEEEDKQNIGPGYCVDGGLVKMEVTSCILSGFAFSDHALVSTSLRLENSLKRPSHFLDECHASLQFDIR